jgi:hypothetical protein
MKHVYGFLILSVVIMSGCASGKYVVDETLSQRREFGPNSRETQVSPNNPVADTDDWIRRNMW